MKPVHLSESDIQRFVFDISNCEPYIIEHISTCNVCKRKTKDYLIISKAIKNQPRPTFDFDMEALVLEKINTLVRPKEHHYMVYFLIAVGIGVAIISLYVFMGNLVKLFVFDNPNIVFFILGIAILISILVSFDMLKSFNKKLKMMDYL